MTFHPYGDSAMLINFEQKIDVQINYNVIELSQYIELSKWKEILFLIPTYCALTIGYNPLLSSYDILVDKINELIKSESFGNDIKPQEIKSIRTITIPVCYETVFAMDIEKVGEKKSLTQEEIVKIHTASIYQVYMLGFLPGFPYLGSLADELICNRKDTPRIKVPAGSVGIAGSQTGIYPIEAPGGWQIIGRTPLDIFKPKSDNPFLFRVGDRVQFAAIDVDVFREIETERKVGRYDLAKLYV